MKKIAIIGMGHMGKALASGLIASGYPKEHFFTSNDPATNKKIVTDADVVILAVKPMIIADVLKDLKEDIHKKIIVSVAAGVSMTLLQEQTSDMQKIIRLMPNLPIQYNQGILGFYANKNILHEEKEETLKIFSKLGKVIDCKSEDEIDVITVIAGCGPALVAYFITMLTQSAQKFGLKKDVADALSLQTFLGTFTFMQKTNQQAEELQAAVATKGGVTAAIIASLDEKRIPSQFVESLGQGYAKIEKIKIELENQK